MGGHRKLPMADFRDTLAGLGLNDVATYIQSGNAVFRADGRSAALAAKISDAVMRGFGFRADVLVMRKQDLAAAIAHNPFPDAETDPARLHLYFGFGEIDAYDPTALSELATQGEEFETRGRVFYLHTPNGIGRSQLAAKLGRFIKTPMSARNFRSCRKILDLSQKMSAP